MVKISFEDFGDPVPQSSDSDGDLSLKLTDAAAAQIESIIAKKEDKNLHLRVAVRGGGCNGFSYIFELTSNVKENDQHISNENYPTISVLVDDESFKLLKGSTIDFEDTLEASQFIVKNPNAASSCGCGSSFSV